METEPVVNSPNFQHTSNNSPISQEQNKQKDSAALPNQNNSRLLPIIITLMISAVVFGIGEYYLSAQLGNRLTYQKQTDTTPTPSPQTKASPTPTSLVSTDNPSSNWITYTNPEKGFSIQYPPDWVVEESDDPSVVLKIIKHLPENSVNKQYCRPGITNGGTDCYPEVYIEVSTAEKPNGYVSVVESKEQNSPAAAFKNSLKPEKEEFIHTAATTLKLEFIREDSYYPSFAFADLEREILRFRAYAPSSKNCLGACPEYSDSIIVRDAAQQIREIITSLTILK